nr:hypothetical protein [Tanacetum cinerariifolium]
MAALGSQNIVVRRVTDDLIDFSGETSVPRYMKFFLVQKIAESRHFVNHMRDEVETLRGCIGQLTAIFAKLKVMRDQDEVNDSLLATNDAKLGKESKLSALNEVSLLSMGPFFILDKLTEVAESSRLTDKMKVVFDQARREEESLEALMRDVSFSLRVSLSKKRRLATELEALREQGDVVRALENMKEIVLSDSLTLADLEQLLARAQAGLGLKDGYFADVRAKA